MPKQSFILNGKRVSVNCQDDMRLLWVIRDLLGVRGPGGRGRGSGGRLRDGEPPGSLGWPRLRVYGPEPAAPDMPGKPDTAHMFCEPALIASRIRL